MRIKIRENANNHSIESNFVRSIDEAFDKMLYALYYGGHVYGEEPVIDELDLQAIDDMVENIKTIALKYSERFNIPLDSDGVR